MGFFSHPLGLWFITNDSPLNVKEKNDGCKFYNRTSSAFVYHIYLLNIADAFTVR